MPRRERVGTHTFDRYHAPAAGVGFSEPSSRVEARRGRRLREPRKPSLSRFLGKFARERVCRAERLQALLLYCSGRFAKMLSPRPLRPQHADIRLLA